MPQQARVQPAVYDQQDHHEGRRRVVADWGGDEVFARTPRRRAKTPALSSVEAFEHDALIAAPEDESEGRPEAAPLRLVEPPEAAYEPHFEPERAPNGRRTVTITGRPGLAVVPTVRTETTIRRRPPRTVEQRLGNRPDRIAGWAFGLGIALILAAVATADAAPL